MVPIRKLKIINFRGLHDQEINCAGKRLNAIIGQNGSMKTTILGIIASSFSLKSSPMGAAKTIDDMEYGIDLTSRFKFSPVYDLAGSHEWSIDMSKA
ncbi:MAG: ATP-binding protein, partial [Lachnospiraceae bacterium]|nr:ATP-binding protein [Lachnospiraceae bacterium]